MPEVLNWETSADGASISREFTFRDFAEALAFTNQIGALAEEANHHPDIMLSWGKVRVSLTTHETGGVSEKDVILAGKIDALTRK